jgi:thioesterase domain-containing protein
MNPDELTAYLHAHIPVTRSLGARALHHDAASLRLAAPLAPNLNHAGTAFGGSMSALAILAGWALVHLKLRERGIPNRLVVQRSAMEFLAPVDGDFTATAALPAPDAWRRFLATLERHGRARVTVPVTVLSSSGAGARHEGTYAAVRLPG